MHEKGTTMATEEQNPEEQKTEAANASGEASVEQSGEQLLALPALLAGQTVEQSLPREVHRRILSDGADVR